MKNLETRTPLPIYNWRELRTSPDYERIFRRNEKLTEGFLGSARDIFAQVQQRGDQAIVDLELKYSKTLSADQYHSGNLRLTDAEVNDAYRRVNEKELLPTIQEYNRGVRMVCEALMHKEKEEVTVERVPGFIAKYKMVPRESVGVYCPAGQVPLPIVSGMLVTSASVAGVPRIAVFYPPTEHDAEIIVAGKEAGATEFYRIGGAQAMAAMTYGTNTVKPFDMIIGPGSAITQAGKIIAREKGMATDSIGGPSEQLVVVEEGAPIESIIMAARDILTECEHGETSAGIVITNSSLIAEKIRNIILEMTDLEERKDVINEALTRTSAIIVTQSVDEMISVAMEYRGEHVGLYMNNPVKYADKVASSSVSLNPHNVSSFMSTARANYGGTLHATLPTGPHGNRQPGPTSPRIFLREIEIMTIKPESATIGLEVCEELAEAEKLASHRNAMRVTRLLTDQNKLKNDSTQLGALLKKYISEYVKV